MRARKRNPFWGQGLDKRQARRARRQEPDIELHSAEGSLIGHVPSIHGAEQADEVIETLLSRKPRWTDLFGIDPNFTEGKPIDEWLEEQRGDP